MRLSEYGHFVLFLSDARCCILFQFSLNSVYYHCALHYCVCVLDHFFMIVSLTLHCAKCSLLLASWCGKIWPFVFRVVTDLVYTWLSNMKSSMALAVVESKWKVWRTIDVKIHEFRRTQHRTGQHGNGTFCPQCTCWRRCRDKQISSVCMWSLSFHFQHSDAPIQKPIECHYLHHHLWQHTPGTHHFKKYIYIFLHHPLITLSLALRLCPLLLDI